jgi:hypothetical protein
MKKFLENPDTFEKENEGKSFLEIQRAKIK